MKRQTTIWLPQPGSCPIPSPALARRLAQGSGLPRSRCPERADHQSATCRTAPLHRFVCCARPAAGLALENPHLQLSLVCSAHPQRPQTGRIAWPRSVHVATLPRALRRSPRQAPIHQEPLEWAVSLRGVAVRSRHYLAGRQKIATHCIPSTPSLGRSACVPLCVPAGRSVTSGPDATLAPTHS
jgi:hypothetical protein